MLARLTFINNLVIRNGVLKSITAIIIRIIITRVLLRKREIDKPTL